MGITKSLEKTRGDNNTRMGDNNGYQRLKEETSQEWVPTTDATKFKNREKKRGDNYHKNGS
jgi:hypothetical protein